jgi:hypothetical protein
MLAADRASTAALRSPSSMSSTASTERTFPHEARAGDRPSGVAVTFVFGYLWQLQGQTSGFVDTHHAGDPTAPPGVRCCSDTSTP